VDKSSPQYYIKNAGITIHVTFVVADDIAMMDIFRMYPLPKSICQVTVTNLSFATAAPPGLP